MNAYVLRAAAWEEQIGAKQEKYGKNYLSISCVLFIQDIEFEGTIEEILIKREVWKACVCVKFAFLQFPKLHDEQSSRPTVPGFSKSGWNVKLFSSIRLLDLTLHIGHQEGRKWFIATSHQLEAQNLSILALLNLLGRVTLIESQEYTSKMQRR